MLAYIKAIKKVLEKWPNIKVKLLDRMENEETNTLARLGTTSCPSEGRWIQVETLLSPTIEAMILNLINHDKKDWRIPIKKYIIEGSTLKDPLEIKKVSDEGGFLSSFALQKWQPIMQ